MTANSFVLDRPLAQTRSTGTMVLATLLFAVLTGAAALVSFPLAFSPVPVTLQTLAVVLAGAILGPVWGPASQLLYIGAGVSGMPVFAGGAAGPAVLAGPTGGYLVGFVVGSWVAGLTTRPGVPVARLFLGLLAAHAAIFVCGLSQLMVFLGASPRSAVELGLLPFLPGLAVKMGAGIGLLRPKRLTGWFRP